MSEAVSYFFYGFFVTLPSLLIAAGAHDKLYPTLLALDLISLRTKRATLATTEGKRAVSRLSYEIWGRVRVALEDMEWIEAEAHLVSSVLRWDRLNVHTICPQRCSQRARTDLKWTDIEELGVKYDLDLDATFYRFLQQPFNKLAHETKRVSIGR